MDNVFRLNLPSIFDRLVTDWGKVLTTRELRNITNVEYGKTKYSIYKHLDTNEILLDSYKEWEGISWDFLILFFKNGYTGRIHTDPESWCINWICSGVGVFEFWNEDQCNSKTEILDTLSLPINIFTTEQKPLQKFVLYPGAYLFNSSMPHRTGGFNQRMMFSLRSKNNNMSWNESVQYFKKYII